MTDEPTILTGQGLDGLPFPASQIDQDTRLVHEGIDRPGWGYDCDADEVAVSLRSALLAVDSRDPNFRADHDYLPDLPAHRLRDAIIRALGYWEAKLDQLRREE